jgi:hypothetical protein
VAPNYRIVEIYLATYPSHTSFVQCPHLAIKSGEYISLTKAVGELNDGLFKGEGKKEALSNPEGISYKAPAILTHTRPSALCNPATRTLISDMG